MCLNILAALNDPNIEFFVTFIKFDFWRSEFLSTNERK